MVSSPDFANSLTISNSASAHYTLAVMTVVAVIATPLVLLYQGVDVLRLPRARSAAESCARADRSVHAASERRLALVRALDPRLLRRARPARVLLGVDAAIGIVAARARAASRRRCSRGSSRARSTAPRSHAVSTALLLLLLVFAGARRARVGIRGRGSAGRVERALRTEARAGRAATARQPTALDGAASAEIATAAVQGVDSLEAYFARYLPQVVLACVVPVAVLALGRGRRRHVGARPAADAAARAGVHVADRPLHGGADAQALAVAPAALRALPRRRPRPADAARVQPRRGAGRERSRR